ncbi:MAG TPA: hypothetical protein VMQ52_00045 [Candidatus Saccharimonadales bacterium]|jgi:hypothetical protein|nr:hypothetical protein [Candidatus Saccharimonadales bacterium]
MQITRQQYIIYSQLCLFVSMLMCIAIKPKGLAANGGISYYGTFLETAVPYTIGILGGAYFGYRLAKTLHKASLKYVRLALIVISILSIGIVLTPYSINAVLDWTHTILGSIIFILELVISGWVIKSFEYDSTILVLGLLEFICGVLAAIYTRPPHGFLIQSQLLFQLFFGIILYRSFNGTKLVAEKQFA